MEQKEQLTEEEGLKNVIEDLEESIEVNNQFIADIISSKLSMDASMETDCTVLIPVQAYQLILEENKRLQEAIDRIAKEEQVARASIEAEEAYLKDSKQRKKQKNKQIQEQIEKLRQETLQKESKIQELEAYASQLESEIESLEHSEPIDPAIMLQEAKNLLSKVKRQYEKAEEQKATTVSQCRDLEHQIKKLTNVIKASGGQVSLCTDAILDKDFFLDVNYENYWFSHKKDLNLSVQEDLDSYLGDNYGGELRKLELAYQIKTEELQSVNRVLRMLESQNTLLNQAFDKKINSISS